MILDTTLAEARARIPPEVGTLTEVTKARPEAAGSGSGSGGGGGVLLRARAGRLDGMARLLAGLGWPFVVVAPAALRTAVRDLATHLAAQADCEP